MRTQRTSTIYLILFAAWIIIAFWLTVEHTRFVDVTRQTLINRANDISTSLGVVIRSQGPFIVLLRPRLEAALKELVESSDLDGVALLNQVGAIVAAAGDIEEQDISKAVAEGIEWRPEKLMLVNLVALGPSFATGYTTGTALVIDPEAEASPTTSRNGSPPPGPPPAEERSGRGRPQDAPPPGDRGPERQTGRGPDGDGPAWSDEGRRHRRPFWMDREQFEDMLKQQGLHEFILVMSADQINSQIARDMRLRIVLGLIALIAVVGLGLAWKAIERSALLQIRLMRAKEMNSHLREMNVAAAGLAHETRNPLNIIRGMTQIISADCEVAPAIRQRSMQILEEVDRITSRLNEFIDYSKPLEARPAPVTLTALIDDVQRTLQADQEDKDIRLTLSGPDFTVLADEPMLRQALFNLMLNAYQAVERNGHVEILFARDPNGEVSMTVCDNGPGVPPEAREDIFRPYVTLHEGGTGLGLAVARQIALAHGWEIEYVDGPLGGAAFRISGMKSTSRT